MASQKRGTFFFQRPFIAESDELLWFHTMISPIQVVFFGSFAADSYPMAIPQP